MERRLTVEMTERKAASSGKAGDPHIPSQHERENCLFRENGTNSGECSTAKIADQANAFADNARPEILETLAIAGLKPTRQRIQLASLLFLNASRHVTAEMLYEEALQTKIKVSLATVYNTLRVLTDAGLLRQIGVDGCKTYYDTNVAPHHHYYLENGHELADMPDIQWIRPSEIDVPEGYETSRIDVVVRLRRKR